MNLRCTLLLGVVLAALGACDEGQIPVIPTTGPQLLAGQDCDSLVPEHCGFPMPSNVYLADDVTPDPLRPTHKHVAFGATTLPAYKEGMHIDPATFADHDGFAASMPPMTFLQGATVTGLPTQENLALSVTKDSPTILLDADTGELVPHFAELDMSGIDDDQRALLIHPMVRLADATRYIVAIRHVVDASGVAIAPSAAFQALRDGSSSSDLSVGRRRPLYADIFAKLRTAGIEQSDLQIAWDYSTSSRDNNTKRMLAMRDDALATVGGSGPDYAIQSVIDNPSAHVRRRIIGKMTVPLYLSDSNVGGSMHVGPDGLPTKNGTAAFPFEVNIPNSVANAAAPAPLLQNGHGLFGRMSEGEDGYLTQFADDYGYVAFSINLLGMDETEPDYILNNVLFNDLGLFQHSVDRQHQGMIDELLLMRLMKGKFVSDPNVQFNGHSAIDPSRVYYRGDSQGGIFGTTYMSLTTDVTRGMLGEPGMPYSLLLNRSKDFAGFAGILHIVYKDQRDVQIAISLLDLMWERTEPDGYAPYITRDMFPSTPEHRVLIEAAIGDYQVTPLGAEIIARTVGAVNVAPVNREVFGLTDANAPIDGSAIAEYTFPVAPAPETNVPPLGAEGTDPHGKLRSVDSSQKQVDAFFRTGLVQQFCDGLCKGN